ncbi:glycosyltransferase [Halobacillus hunanensis]|uniref:glycosyltransferase n=1 Tax=Halobacillus hunanensis TaxID=578214 RepID=UPI0009A848CE|nr:glycosyltransferase [Halobacillus hunanensis]
MKVLHLCLASFYIDNYSYQENLLPKYHKELGYEVEIITSLISFDQNGKTYLLNNGGKYINEFGIPVTRLEYKGSKVSSKLRQYKGTYEEISSAKPDIIFIHGVQFLDINHVVRYCKEHPEVKVFIDNHADFSNSATNFLSKNILHKVIWRHCAHLIEPYTKKYYGVLPARVDFLKTIYKIPKEKVELLVMGADDEKVTEANNINIKRKIRKKYNVKNDDFLIITGGKIDTAKKQTLLLMQAIKQIQSKKIKLIVFGSVVEELKEEVNSLVDDDRVQYIGWVKAEDSYKYFASADLAVFPGRHSVFWEQAVGIGVPCIFKYWKGTTHIDLGGNCKFLYKDTVEEIRERIIEILNNEENYVEMKKTAETKGMKAFSYAQIAKDSLEV